MCQKQCRDQNGFKCHLTSESHQRQLLLFGESPGQYLYEFSSEFKKCFLDILRRQFGTKRVKANIVYNEYIKEKNHVHMNSTHWHTLTGFVNYLGREGIAKIDHTEKGWFIQYIDPEEQERKDKVVKKQKMDKDDDERIQELIEKQAEKALLSVKTDEQESKEPKYTELNKVEGEKIEFALSTSKKTTETLKSTEMPSTSSSVFKKPQVPKRKADKSSDEPPQKSKAKSSLQEILESEEERKEIKNRKDYWLHEDIVVKVVTKKLGEKYYKKKGFVKEIIDRYTANVKMIGSNDILKLDQTHLETVIPAIGKTVLVVNGAYRGHRAILESLNEKKFSVSVRIDEGPTKDRIVNDVQYEDICKLYTD